MNPGDGLEPQTYAVRRADLVRYAGASGDFNPIHWSDRVATAVGLPGVIAHGMYTMALAARAVATWTDGAEVVELGCKFTNPVVVPDDDEGVARVHASPRWTSVAVVVQTRSPLASRISLRVPMMSLPPIWRRDATARAAVSSSPTAIGRA